MKLIPTLMVCAAIMMTTGCIASKKALLYTPALPVSAASLSEDQLRKDVAVAAAERGWTVLEQKPGHTKVTITVRNKHTATVDIVYTNSLVTINYIDSVNLDYVDKGGSGRIIHKTYNRWVNNLADDIRRKINADVILKQTN